tara:strand:+ start:4000 stop:4485 length:486 start_codon:yes stop_codon:yes gene_type:complete
MGRSVLEIIFEKHNEWIYMVMAFGCNKESAEDIVQDMYLRMNKIINKGNNVMYNETEVNGYYVLKTLKSIFIDKTRKESRYVEIDYDKEAYKIDIEITPDYHHMHDKITKELKELYWFDRMVYEIIQDGQKISVLSREANIPYYTLYNTYKKVEKHLKKLL